MNLKSSKYNMRYYTIAQIEKRLNKQGLKTRLWSVSNTVLGGMLEDEFSDYGNRQISVLKDAHPEKDERGFKQFSGVFFVSAERILTPSEVELVFMEYIKSNPGIDRSISVSLHGDVSGTSVVVGEINDNNGIDLNAMADSLDNDSLVFGVIDDPAHINLVGDIQGVELIRNFGDFSKVYFSIPSYKQAHALAHSVTILKCVKCRNSLMDYVVQ